jgi:hypothetical protein
MATSIFEPVPGHTESSLFFPGHTARWWWPRGLFWQCGVTIKRYPIGNDLSLNYTLLVRMITWFKVRLSLRNYREMGIQNRLDWFSVWRHYLLSIYMLYLTHVLRLYNHIFIPTYCKSIWNYECISRTHKDDALALWGPLCKLLSNSKIGLARSHHNGLAS